MCIYFSCDLFVVTLRSNICPPSAACLDPFPAAPYWFAPYEEFGIAAPAAAARITGFEAGGLFGCISSGLISDYLIQRDPKVFCHHFWKPCPDLAQAIFLAWRLRRPHLWIRVLACSWEAFFKQGEYELGSIGIRPTCH